VLVAVCSSTHRVLKNGLRYEVLELGESLMLRCIGDGGEARGEPFALAVDEVAESLRLTHALCYFSAQARTMLAQTYHPRFELTHLIVGLGLGPTGATSRWSERSGSGEVEAVLRKTSRVELSVFAATSAMSGSSSSTDTQVCSKCHEEHELAAFRVGWRRRDGQRRLKNECRRCSTREQGVRRHLWRSAGPPSPSCEICRRLGQTQLDHDHVTGKFRGWLCGTCNAGLGMLGDDAAGLRRALAYLERSSAAHSGLDEEERARSHSPRRDGDPGGAAPAGESQ
jgi:hypothetical protein